MTAGDTDAAPIRTVKLARLRAGVYADGTPVGPEPEPPRLVHVVDIAADLTSPDGVTAHCGSHFASGTLPEVPWDGLKPHAGTCRQQYEKLS